MASVYKYKDKYRVQLYAGGKRESGVFPTRREAAAWALEREAELRGQRLPEKTLLDAMRRFANEVSETRGGGDKERIRLKSFERFRLAGCRLEALTPADFSAWRDMRLADGLKPGSVARDMNLLRAVLEVARRDWHWLRENPMRDVRWPKQPKGRARRISAEEERTLVAGFGLSDGLKVETATQRVGLTFLFALETAMRSGEIVGLTWGNVHLAQRFVRLPKTKNGDLRDVPLSSRAIEILRALPVGADDALVFGLQSAMRDALFRKVRDKTPHKAVHFHDARAEAIWRLSKRLDVMQLARVIGHRDLKSLMIYYSESASAMAELLE